MARRYDDEALDQMALVKRMGTRPVINGIEDTTQPGAMQPNIEPVGPVSSQAPSAAPAAATPAPATSQQPADPLAGIDTSKWDHDNFAKPGYIAGGASKQAPAGFEQANWDDPNMQTPKYVVGRILSQYQGQLNNPQALQKMGAELAQAYPGAKFDGKDLLTMPDGSVVDIISAGGSDAAAPYFQPVRGAGGVPLMEDGPAPGGGMPGAGIGAGVDASQLMSGGFFQKLMEQMRGRLSAGGSQDQSALLSLMKR
jgi:hypothetical protein